MKQIFIELKLFSTFKCRDIENKRTTHFKIALTSLTKQLPTTKYKTECDSMCAWSCRRGCPWSKIFSSIHICLISHSWPRLRSRVLQHTLETGIRSVLKDTIKSHEHAVGKFRSVLYHWISHLIYFRDPMREREST